MGKSDGPMTAKAIGNKIKAKGLQKLKFYCQMCQKQCRDANGFKCHQTSEAHLRQLLLFTENPNKYMDSFSADFLKDFLSLLKRRYSTKRIMANTIYQEYIKEREHIHMNSTRWTTLGGFVKWLGRKSICDVEEIEGKFYMTYIDRDPETLARQENLAKKDKMAKDDEERQAKMIKDQIARGVKHEENSRKRQLGEGTSSGDDGNAERKDPEEGNKDEEKHMLKRDEGTKKISFSFASKSKMKKFN